MKHHGQLVQDAEEAIKELHGDTSVSQETTRDDLKSLRETIDMLIDAINEDLK